MSTLTGKIAICFRCKPLLYVIKDLIKMCKEVRLKPRDADADISFVRCFVLRLGPCLAGFFFFA